MARTLHCTRGLAAILAVLFLTACSGQSSQPKPVESPPISTPADPVKANPSAPPTSHSPAPQKSDPRISQANQLLLQGDFAPAAELLLATIGDLPDSAEAWDLLAFAFNRLKRYRAAAGAGDRAVYLAPQSAAARFNAGLAWAMVGDYERAAAHVKVAVERNEQSAAPAYLLGAVYEQSGHRAQALETYEGALKSFPADADLARAKAALQGDLNLDGTPETVIVKENKVTVTDGASGSVLLAYEEESARMETVNAKVADLGGTTPALIVQARLGGALFAWRGGTLTKLGSLPRGIGIYRPTLREYSVGELQNGGSTLTVVRIDQEQMAKQVSTEGDQKEPQPLLGLTDLATAAVDLQPMAFVQSDLVGQVINRFGTNLQGHSWAAFLLPDSGGGYRLELHLDGAVVTKGTAKVRSAPSWQIETLTW